MKITNQSSQNRGSVGCNPGVTETIYFECTSAEADMLYRGDKRMRGVHFTDGWNDGVWKGYVTSSTGLTPGRNQAYDLVREMAGATREQA